MKSLALQLFRASLKLLPSGFRLQYELEMEEVFLERMRERSTRGIALLVIGEVRDLAVVAVRARLEQSHLALRYVIPGIATAIALTVIALSRFAVPARGAHEQARIDFSAQDPAGQFTLSILEGLPVSITMNRRPLPIERVVHLGDSIHVLARSGKIVLALAYYRDTGRIEWKPRPAACHSDPAECDAYQ
ncbi:MAG: hypothetical protein ABI556_13095 [Gemmatimonadales bacterium]